MQARGVPVVMALRMVIKPKLLRSSYQLYLLSTTCKPNSGAVSTQCMSVIAQVFTCSWW